jgi:uncharacterized membrane protein
MKQARIAGWMLMTYLSLLVGIASLMYVSDPARYDLRFADKYVTHHLLVLLHGFCAVTALLIGPFGFSAGLRARLPLLHRVLGRLYLAAVGIAAVTGFEMGLMAYGGWPSALAFCTFALLWLQSGWKALDTARRRRFDEHRRWMTRNYALTFGAVMLRLYLYGAQHAGYDFDAIYPLAAWLGWVPNIILVEWYLARSQSRPARREVPHEKAETGRELGLDSRHPADRRHHRVVVSYWRDRASEADGSHRHGAAGSVGPGGGCARAGASGEAVADPDGAYLGVGGPG